MSAPNNATAAFRPGGKFANRPPRGKFANLASASAASQSASSGNVPLSVSTTTAAAFPSTPTALQQQQQHQKEAARLARCQRQEKIFSDLDEAENLVLGMLSLVSSTTGALSEWSGTSKKKNDDENILLKEKKLLKLVTDNGDSYLEKLKRVHSLLTPHSHLVVAYRNHAVDTEGGGGKKEKKNNNDSNMYASRVEKRLAMERRDIMQELLRLETKEMEEEERRMSSRKRERDG